MIAGNTVVPRAVHVLLSTIVVLLLSLGAGPISKVLALPPLVRLGRFELDFYVFHQPCIWLTGFLIGGKGRMALSAFVLTVSLVFLWRAFGKFLTGCKPGFRLS